MLSVCFVQLSQLPGAAAPMRAGTPPPGQLDGGSDGGDGADDDDSDAWSLDSSDSLAAYEPDNPYISGDSMTSALRRNTGAALAGRGIHVTIDTQAVRCGGVCERSCSSMFCAHSVLLC